MDFNDVDKAFAKLIIDEDHGIGGGVPRMKATNQALDIAYLKGKLRLYCRTLLYSSMAGESYVDLEKADFSAAHTLLEQKEKYLAVDIALFLFTRLSSLLRIPETEITLGDLKEYLSLYDKYADQCSLQEKIELLSITSSYFAYLSNRGRVEFTGGSILLFARVIHLQYPTKGRKKKTAYLNPSIFYSLTTVGRLSLSREGLLEINHVIDWPMDKVDFTVSEWITEFSRLYSPCLDPKVRKPYRDIYKAVHYFLEEDYLKSVDVLKSVRFPDSGIINMDPIRLLYYSVFSLYYHGTPNERKAIRRRKLTPHLLLDRFRKRLDYQINNTDNSSSAKRLAQDYFVRMQAMQKSYDLVYGPTHPSNLSDIVEKYLIPVREGMSGRRRQNEIIWMGTQLELLEQELKRMKL